MLAKLFFTVEKSTSLLAKGPVCSTHANADSWCLVCAQPCGQVARFRQPKTYVFLSLTFRNFKQMKVDYRSSESLCYGLKVWFIVYTIPLNLICYIWGRNQMNGIAVFWSRVKWQREQSITCKMLMLLPLLQLCYLQNNIGSNSVKNLRIVSLYWAGPINVISKVRYYICSSHSRCWIHAIVSTLLIYLFIYYFILLSLETWSFFKWVLWSFSAQLFSQCWTIHHCQIIQL